MESFEFNPSTGERPPNTLAVLGLLALAATVFSYLGAYCLTDALVAAEVRLPISGDHDPRPKWFAVGWFVLMVTFLFVGWVMRVASARQMRSIDAMEMD